LSGYRFYDDLAAWWPLISPRQDYAEEAAYAASLLATAEGPVERVLELGSGGGSNASYLKARFALTLVDLSPGMLAVSQRLNPECEHVQGDMRTIRLGRTFDAVFVHDAVDYMTTRADLAAAIATAFAHCRPGGVAVFVPDQTRETFTAGADHGGSDGDDGRGVRFVEWTWDPDADDTSTLTEYAFLLRDPDGSVDVFHETHRTGLFHRRDWLELLAAAGFDAEHVVEETAEDRPPRDVFIGRRPARSTGGRSPSGTPSTT
jgi:trans-aconitate methyltransferase